MLKCRDISRQASDYIDRNLSLGQRSSIRFHLLICTKCRLFVQHMSSAVAFFRKQESKELDDHQAKELTNRILENAAAELNTSGPEIANAANTDSEKKNQ